MTVWSISPRFEPPGRARRLITGRRQGDPLPAEESRPRFAGGCSPNHSPILVLAISIVILQYAHDFHGKVTRPRPSILLEECTNASCSSSPGEALAAGRGFGVDVDTTRKISEEIAEVLNLGIQVALVIGGGNFFPRRGRAGQGHGTGSPADHMGMLGTVINSLALQDALEKVGVHSRVMSAIEMNQVAEPYIRRRAIRHMEKGPAWSSSLPARVTRFFSTDNGGFAPRHGNQGRCASEGHQGRRDLRFRSGPPIRDAVKFETLTYMEILQKNLKVMDMTAVSLCKGQRPCP